MYEPAHPMMFTSIKILFINTIIVIGSAAIVWEQWPEAIRPRGFGTGYEQGPGANVFLALLLVGIPVILYAIAVHVALSHWLFQPGELKTHRARQLIKSLPTSTPSHAPVEDVAHDD